MTDAPPPTGTTDDFDGHSLEELADYLDRGRTPLDPSIEGSPACRIALRGLERLRAMATQVLEQDAAHAPARDGWIGEVLGRIGLESRAGRRFAYTGLPPGVEGEVTEGALRGLVRAVGDSIPGVLTGRIRLHVDPGTGVLDLQVDITVFYGTPIDPAAAELRSRIARVLPMHAPFAVGRLDLQVRDVLVDGPEA